MFLATRPFAGQSTLLGRETYLLPVTWENGWPHFLKPGETVPAVLKKPDLPVSAGTNWRSWRDDFNTPLSGEWIGLRTPGPQQKIVLDRAAGELSVIPGPDGAGGLGDPAFIGRRLRHHDAQFTASVDFAPDRDGDFAGLLALMDEAHFLTLGIEEGGIVLRRRSDANAPARGEEIARKSWSGNGPVELRIAFKGGRADAVFRPRGTSQWQTVASGFDVEPLASVHAGLFTGLVVGPYAVATD